MFRRKNFSSTNAVGGRDAFSTELVTRRSYATFDWNGSISLGTRLLNYSWFMLEHSHVKVQTFMNIIHANAPCES